MNSGRRLAASAASKRQHSAQQILSNLLAAEVAEKKARSIRYQLGDAKLPLAKPLTEFDFTASPINEILVRDPHDGSFLKTQRNAFCIGGTGTGKTHIGIAITANCVRCGARACFFNLIDLVNGWRPRPGPDGRGGSPTNSPASISSCWTNWATCPSLRLAASCCSIWSDIDQHTASDDSAQIEWIRVSAPHHPWLGPVVRVVRRLRRDNGMDLVVEGEDGQRQMMPLGWTEAAHVEESIMPVLRLTPGSLRALVRLVKACRTSLPAEARHANPDPDVVEHSAAGGPEAHMPLPDHEEASKKEGRSHILAVVGSRKRQADKDHDGSNQFFGQPTVSPGQIPGRP